jgi:hypothetical protein
MRDAYIVTSVRTPGCRRGKGALKDTRPEDLLAFIMKAAVEKTGKYRTRRPRRCHDRLLFSRSGTGVEHRPAGHPDCRFSGHRIRRHRQPLLLLGTGSHRPGIIAGHGRLVRNHHGRRCRIHDLRAHGRQPAPPSSRTFKRPMPTSMPPWASRRKTWPTVMV